MAHPRTDIRLAVIAQLVAANTAAGTRVEDTPIDTHKRSRLPVLGVYTLNEPAQKLDGSAPVETERVAQVEIVAWVGGSESADIMLELDDIAAQIEAAIDADPYINNNARESALEDTTIEFRVENGASSPLVGILSLTYAMSYRTSPAAPAALDDFRTVNATQKVGGGVADTVPVVDQFTVQEPPP